MTDLIITKDDKATTTSLIVAEKFGKRHADIMRKIDNLIKDDKKNYLRNFALVEIIDKNANNGPINKSYYEMDRKCFSILVMSFTGQKALKWKIKFYDAFETMEKELANRTSLADYGKDPFIQLRISQIELENKQNEQNQRIKQLEAKVDFNSANTDFFTIRAYCSANNIRIPLDVAKQMGRKASRLSKTLAVRCGTAPDELFGKVKTYHKDILDTVFKATNSAAIPINRHKEAQL